MLERTETFMGEQLRRQEERQYAEAYRLSKQGLGSKSSRREMLCSLMISTGKRLIKMGEKIQGPMEKGANPIAARVQ